MPKVILAAPAKLNLHLEILGQRSDGFHELETLFQTIDLHDRVEVSLSSSAAPGIALICDDPSLPADRRNLAWRAAESFLANADQSLALSIVLHKNIPHGAGLGGGSSDAAAVLRALHDLLPGIHDAAGIAALAADLGSDVPFFLLGGTALGHGRGEILSSLPDLPRRPVTVFMPDASVSTPAAFAALTADERGPRLGHDARWWQERLAGDPMRVGTNRLTGPARRLCPPVGELLDWLNKQGAPYLMSGSGAACFALAHLDPPPGVRAWRSYFCSRERALALTRVRRSTSDVRR